MQKNHGPSRFGPFDCSPTSLGKSLIFGIPPNCRFSNGKSQHFLSRGERDIAQRGDGGDPGTAVPRGASPKTITLCTGPNRRLGTAWKGFSWVVLQPSENMGLVTLFVVLSMSSCGFIFQALWDILVVAASEV